MPAGTTVKSAGCSDPSNAAATAASSEHPATPISGGTKELIQRLSRFAYFVPPAEAVQVMRKSTGPTTFTTFDFVSRASTLAVLAVAIVTHPAPALYCAERLIPPLVPYRA